MSTVKNILVTGGAGYIGSHTVVELINNGFSPVIIDDFRNSQQKIIDGIQTIVQQDVCVRKIDVGNIKELRSVFEEFDFDGIIHFAAYKAVGESVEKPLDYYRNNIVGILNCLELAIEFNVENFVFSSSCTVYGEPEGSKVVTESTPQQRASSPYGNTKKIGERISHDLVDSGAQIKILNLRYFNPVGAHESALIGELPIGKPNNLLPIVTKVGIGNMEILRVNGKDYSTIDGTCVRDYVHVSDVADAHVKGVEWLMSKDGAFVEEVNIGTGKGTSVLEIIHTFEKVSGVDLNWEFADRREGDIVEIYADVTKSFELLNWKAKKTAEDAVRDAWNWELKLKND